MKTICIYHSRDLDGWMSAAIVRKWWTENVGFDIIRSEYNSDGILDPILTIGYSGDEIYFLGWDYGDDIPDLSRYDRVIMCDISFPAQVMCDLHWNLRENFIWNDHHISAINDSLNYSYRNSEGLKLTTFSACELTWKYLFPSEEMPEIVRRLGRYDCFGHKGTDEELTIVTFQYGARNIITNYEEAYDALLVNEGKGGLVNRKIDVIMNTGHSIYEWECKQAKETYKKSFPVTFGEYTFLAVNQQRFNPDNFGIKYHNDKIDDIYFADGFASFHMLPSKKWSFSLYNENGEVDCSSIAKRFGGGGHNGAAGFVVDDLNKIIK